MTRFEKPLCDIVRFTNDVVASSCGCDFGSGPIGDDTICQHVCYEAGGDDAECIVTDDQGNC